MAYWILKTEPSTYSFDDLARESKATWDGVKNPVALKNLAAMGKGDTVLIYHTGDEKAVVGLATVAGTAYPDPKQQDARLLVVDIAAERRLGAPVPLSRIKADQLFADSPLVRQGRLSVVPCTKPQYDWLLKAAGA